MVSLLSHNSALSDSCLNVVKRFCNPTKVIDSCGALSLQTESSSSAASKNSLHKAEIFSNVSLAARRCFSHPKNSEIHSSISPNVFSSGTYFVESQLSLLLLNENLILSSEISDFSNQNLYIPADEAFWSSVTSRVSFHKSIVRGGNSICIAAFRSFHLLSSVLPVLAVTEARSLGTQII